MIALTVEQAAIVRAAAELEAIRCEMRAHEHDIQSFAANAAWWRKTAELWRSEAERRIAIGFSACNGWCGVRLEVTA